jgi:hypothetical protein
MAAGSCHIRHIDLCAAETRVATVTNVTRWPGDAFGFAEGMRPKMAVPLAGEAGRSGRARP